MLQLIPKYPQLSKTFTNFLSPKKKKPLNVVIPQLDEQQKINNNNKRTKTAAAAITRRRRRRRAQNNRKLCVFESVLRSILQPPIHEKWYLKHSPSFRTRCKQTHIEIFGCALGIRNRVVCRPCGACVEGRSRWLRFSGDPAHLPLHE